MQIIVSQYNVFLWYGLFLVLGCIATKSIHSKDCRTGVIHTERKTKATVYACLTY